MFTDASDDGYGGFILKRLNKEVCSAKFKDCEKPIENYLPLNMSWIASEKYCEANLFKSIQTIPVLVEFYPPVVLSHNYRILLLRFLIFIQSLTLN